MDFDTILRHKRMKRTVALESVSASDFSIGDFDALPLELIHKIFSNLTLAEVSLMIWFDVQVYLFTIFAGL